MTTDDYLEHESDDTAIYSEAALAADAEPTEEDECVRDRATVLGLADALSEALERIRERLGEQNLTQHRLEEYLGDE